MGKTKSQKQHERRKRLERERNIRQNKPQPSFVLYAKVNAGWVPAMKFFSLEEVDAHIASVEDLRKRNASDIVEAVVMNVGTRKKVRTIAGHKMDDPALIGKNHPASGNTPRPGDISFDTKAATP